jgi:hypothetical protein
MIRYFRLLSPSILTVGARVLIKNPSQSKLDLPFDIGRVVAINQGSLTVSVKGQSKVVPTTGVAPLEPFSSDSSGDRVIN